MTPCNFKAKMVRDKRSFENIFKTSLFYTLDKTCDEFKEFKVQKRVLSKESGYFNAFFKGNFGDNNHTVNLPFHSSILEKILIFIYNGKIYLVNEDIAEVIVAADFLLIDSLLKKCRDFVLQKISLDCCIPFLTVSHVIERLQLKKHCFRFIQMNFRHLVHKSTPNISEIPFYIFKDLISGDSLGVCDEETV